MDYPGELKTRMDIQAVQRHQRAAGDEMGCANASCFCTGRCRRTPEENAAIDIMRAYVSQLEKKHS